MTRRRFIYQLEDLILFLLVTSLLLLTCGQIIMRNLFSISILGTENLVRHLVLWIGLSGALLATRLDKHIRIDTLVRLLPASIRRIFLGSSALISALICGQLTWIAWRFVLDERDFGAIAFFSVPAWIAQLCFPLGFGLMSIRFLCQSWKRFSGPEANSL